jgi:hypothetical protein
VTAAALLQAPTNRGARLTLAGDKLHYRGPAGALTEDLRARIAEHRAALLALLQAPPASCQRWGRATR